MSRSKRRRPRSARKAPADAAALEARGEALVAAGRFPDAARAFEKALGADPGNVRLLNNLGNVLKRLERTDEAADHYARALAREPRSPAALSNLALLKAEAGARAEAAALYRRLLDVTPDDAEAWHDLAPVKDFAAGDPDLEAMERLRARPGLAAAAAMFLDFALAKAYDDIGDHDRAFRHMAAANRSKRASLAYDVARDEALAERIAAAFDRASMAADAGAGHADDRPVFIVGMPRSGTTLVEQILASHSRVRALGEVEHFRDATRESFARLRQGYGGQARRSAQRVRGSPPQEPPRREGGFPEGVRDLAAGDLRRVGAAYAKRIGRTASTVLRVTDKMPRNFFFAGLIRLALPGARIVHCVRDPIDTCLSCFRIHFPHGQAFAYDLGDLGRYYRLYKRLMDHWRAVMPDAILDVRYEDLVADPEPEMRRLLDFCGLAWEDACRDFHRTRRPVRTASAQQVRKPIYRTAVKRWKRYEKHLGPLIDALGTLASGD